MIRDKEGNKKKKSRDGLCDMLEQVAKGDLVEKPLLRKDLQDVRHPDIEKWKHTRGSQE